MKLNFKLSLFLLGNLFLTGSLFSETIILKTGKTFFGRVIEQNRDFLKLKETNGNVLQFQKTEILKVTYKDLNTKEIKKIIDVETKKNQSSLNQVTETNEKFDLNSKKENLTDSSIEKPSPLTPKKIRWEVVGRSAILPGWGQYHWNEPIRGSLYILSFLGAAVHYNQAWNLHKEAKSEYQNDFRSLVIFTSGSSGFLLNLVDKNNLASEYRRTGNNLNTASDILIGVFLINLIDSMLYRGEKEDRLFTSNGRRQGFYANAGVTQPNRFDLDSKDQKFGQGSVEYKLGYTWVF
ncbi:LA_0442/LA_0875 N-terminal domain-containing protein [Leptospira paudalimensis]|uniref:DUF5683 domain-containing protein n=1 Tax=Leptospira paudalimensis TaxID=2950024 RepID=A0ABT3M6F2_9LEPT|nr:hypothetical protein [Leptospira paudalimensis]MCW7503612.1 hypothetical protein [Leptospira paudalimensis]